MVIVVLADACLYILARLGGDLIGSPALDALLHLHLAEAEGQSLSPR